MLCCHKPDLNYRKIVELGVDFVMSLVFSPGHGTICPKGGALALVVPLAGSEDREDLPVIVVSGRWLTILFRQLSAWHLHQTCCRFPPRLQFRRSHVLLYCVARGHLTPQTLLNSEMCLQQQSLEFASPRVVVVVVVVGR